MIVLASTERRAAHGLHTCCWCRALIAASERYMDLRIADSGTCWTQRQHLNCLDLVNRYGRYHALDADEPVYWEYVVEWAAEQHGHPVTTVT